MTAAICLFLGVLLLAVGSWVIAGTGPALVVVGLLLVAYAVLDTRAALRESIEQSPR